MVSVRDEVVGMLQDGPRIADRLEVEIQPNLTNLRIAVGELQNIVVRLAEEIDRLDIERA